MSVIIESAGGKGCDGGRCVCVCERERWEGSEWVSDREALL